MKTKIVLVGIIALAISLPAIASVQEGIDALNRGDYETAFDEFKSVAEAGDDIAMVTIGLWFHEGRGFDQDYDVAMAWYLEAFEKGNGDAYNNIGVMYRDGLGVSVNKPIAYSLFLITHLRGLGSESTQYRANSNLRRIVEATTEEERAQGLCMTESYLEAFVLSGGTLMSPKKSHLPSRRRPRIKDNKQLWLESEENQMTFECPPPWN